MTDPICLKSPNSTVSTFDCEPFFITGEADSKGASASALAAEVTPPSHAEAVNGLVKVVIGHTQIAPVETPALVHIERCLGEADSLAMLLIGGAKNLVLGALAGLKVGYDIAKCEEREKGIESSKLTEKAAELYCVEEGGTPREWVGNTLECAYPTQRLEQ